MFAGSFRCRFLCTPRFTETTIRQLTKLLSVTMDFMNYNPTYKSLKKCVELATRAEVPEDLKAELDRALSLYIQRENYIESMTTPASEHLKEISRKTTSDEYGTSSQSMMLTGDLQGQFLKSLVSMTRAKRVLEIGTFTGYSALAMAESLPADGTLVTCEMDPDRVKMSRQFLDESPHGKKVIIRQGVANDTLRQLITEKAKFDLVFIDSNKEGYISDYDMIMKRGLLAENGTIVCDNTLFYGTPYAETPDSGGMAIRDFNKYVLDDAHVVLLPIRDGVSIIRRKSEMGE